MQTSDLGGTGPTILVIEDDAEIRDLVRVIMERQGMRVIEARDGRDGLRSFYESKPDVVVLDISLPEIDGWQALARIRELSETPVMMLTAADQELEKVRGLRNGADDYVTKPFGRLELQARIEALLRRGGSQEDDVRTIDDGTIEIDLAARETRVDGNKVELTPTEFKLLVALARHPDQVLSPTQLLGMAWGDPTGDPQRVKLYVSYLRRKLVDAAGIDPVRTMRGFGYRYSPRAVDQPESANGDGSG
ncbi:MAG TPA: response regulator transcription factor [Solirubrobacterales bacterium]|nr:response regulator transcription factor [Solirubrobacterales bacterium]